MFPVSNNIDNPYFIPYTNQTFFSNMSSNYSYDGSEHDQNPNSTAQQEEEDPPFSLHFPSPFLDDNQLFFNHIFPHQLIVADDQINHETDLGCRVTNNPSINIINTAEEISTIPVTTAATRHVPIPSSSEAAQKGKTSTSNNNKGLPTQRKRGKKDRHSKIYTAQGLRDRRMRLSLQSARKFFDLQDMLGFDKASKTIDWLFSKSKKAIKQLSCTTNHLPQMSNTVPSIYCQVESEEMRKVLTTSDGENISGERKTQKSRKAAGGGCGTKYNHIAKELRDKARARARERTREKMMMRCLENSKQQYLSDHQTTTSYNLAQLGSAGNPNSVFEAGKEESMSSRSQENIDSPYKDLSSHSSLHLQLANVGILDNFLGTTASSSAAASCSIFDYDQRNDALLFSGGLDSYCNNFLGFLGNRDINSNNDVCTNLNHVLNDDRKKPYINFHGKLQFSSFPVSESS